MVLKELDRIRVKGCACGRDHVLPLDKILVGSGVITETPRIIKEYKAKKVFLLSDKNTYCAAGDMLCGLLGNSGIDYTSYSFDKDSLEPDERNVGLAVMHFDHSCDIIVGVGSGVVNDIGKILSAISNRPYIIVATAPSMDGYASATSSMTRDGLKITLPARSADVIIGDTDILCRAPLKMLKSGLGDMIAKYVSVCEWQMSHLITGEYYCGEIAGLVRDSLRQCVELAPRLLKRDPETVTAVFKGLIICGVAMNYAGLSRPASGVEHYFSHIWDMRGAAFGTPVEFHGLQCAVGTLMAVRLYEKLKAQVPDREKALAYVRSFDLCAWNEKLREFLGKGAESMISLEKREKKYDVEKHKRRLDIIINNWDELLKIMDDLPSSKEIEEILDCMEAPKTLEEIGQSAGILPMTFKASKDLRDKYVLSRLAWDLGIIDEIC